MNHKKPNRKIMEMYIKDNNLKEKDMIDYYWRWAYDFPTNLNLIQWIDKYILKKREG